MSRMEYRLRRLEQQVGTTDDREKREAEMEKTAEANLRRGLAAFGYDPTPELIAQCLDDRRMRLAERRAQYGA